MQKNNENNQPLRAVIVGNRNSISTLKELETLLKTLHIQTEFVFITSGKSPNPVTYLGKGKLEELFMLVSSGEFEIIAVDDELKASQLRNLQQKLRITVLDRPRIILEIFSQRATTKEGKLQVEIATLQRRKTELINQGSSLDQQAGFIGGKGPGEKKVELNRRRLLQRIKTLKEELKRIEKQRTIMRDKRVSSSVFTISLVGYTNAGKSTLFNALTKENLPTDDLLFHTLDTRTRKGYLNSSIGEILYIDTVGFIRKLPHELIEAFKSTLEEIILSDLIIKVVDISDPQHLDHLHTVHQTLEELNASHIPSLLVLNKADAIPTPEKLPEFPGIPPQDIVLVSALQNTGIPDLKKKISEKFFSIR